MTLGWPISEHRTAGFLTAFTDDLTVRLGEAFTDWLRSRGRLTRWHGEDTTGKPLAEETIRTYLRALKAFSSWLAAPKQRYTDENRLHLLKLPKEPQTYKLPLEKGEIQAFIDACDPTTTLGSRDLAMLLVLLDGGLRASELTALLVGHVNVDEGQIFVASGKGRKSRTVTVGADARRMLARYVFFRDAAASAPSSPDAPFFRNLQGGPLQYEALRKWLVRLKQRAGVTRVSRICCGTPRRCRRWRCPARTSSRCRPSSGIRISPPPSATCG